MTLVRIWYAWGSVERALPMWFPVAHALEVGEQLRARGLRIRYQREGA